MSGKAQTSKNTVKKKRKKEKELEEYKNKRTMFKKLTPYSTALAQNQKPQINRMAKNSFLTIPICIL